MKTIPLTHGLVTVVDDADYQWLSAFKWHATRNSRKCKWYAARNGDGTKIRMHREILGAPKGIEVDHKDGDGLNNQRDNLRLATNTQNQRNRSLNKRGNATGYKGVFDSTPESLTRRFGARIYQDRRQIIIGYYATAEEAAKAYDAEAIRLFGEFARPNFSDAKL